MIASLAGTRTFTLATCGHSSMIADAARSLSACALAAAARAALRLRPLAARAVSLAASSSLSRNTITRFQVSSASA